MEIQNAKVKRVDAVAIALELLESGEDTMGVCRACGEVQGGVEPDARHYECESCGTKQVFGAEQVLIEGGL